MAVTAAAVVVVAAALAHFSYIRFEGSDQNKYKIYLSILGWKMVIAFIFLSGFCGKYLGPGCEQSGTLVEIRYGKVFYRMRTQDHTL